MTAILKYRELKGRVESIDDLIENKLITEERQQGEALSEFRIVVFLF